MRTLILYECECGCKEAELCMEDHVLICMECGKQTMVFEEE